MSLMKTLADAFHEGGWPMGRSFPMIIAWGISIEARYLPEEQASIRRSRFRSSRARSWPATFRGAVKVCSGNPTPVTRIIQAGLTKFNRPDAGSSGRDGRAGSPRDSEAGSPPATRHAWQRRDPRRSARHDSRSHPPFAGVAGVDPSMKATLLAMGISEAMNCTAFGLVCAVPALLWFAILNGWTQHTSTTSTRCRSRL